MAGKGRNGRKLAAHVIDARERAARALELRKTGKTFAKIAEELEYNSPQAAHDAVKRALEAVTREPAIELITLELERLDEMFIAPYQAAQAGDVQSIAACLKIMERRAKLLGLDAPVKSETRADVSVRELPTTIDDLV